jgi:hypothetical protein
MPKVNAHGVLRKINRRTKAICLGCDRPFKTGDKQLQRLCDNCKNTWRWGNPD